VAFFGDGAANQGYFHECLNFAAVFALPVLYVCENNLYGEFTPWEEVTAGELRARAETLGIPASTIDGNDVMVVREAAAAAVERARAGDGPQFVEALTYRFVGHSRSDPGRYRKPGELDAWRDRDPIKLARAALLERFGADQRAVGEVEEAVDRQMDAIAERGLAAPWPRPGAVREFKE